MGLKPGTNPDVEAATIGSRLFRARQDAGFAAA